MSRPRTQEERDARHAHARVTVWRAVHDAHTSGEHVVVKWWNRTYDGHITEVADDGFRVLHYEDGGAWCSWEGATKIEPPYWDVAATLERDYPEPCRGCVEVARKATA
jgi:hypothetical protein